MEHAKAPYLGSEKDILTTVMSTAAVANDQAKYGQADCKQSESEHFPVPISAVVENHQEPFSVGETAAAGGGCRF
ncbi:hypothetical protein PENANT_c047G06569 [Penicillium antarcticum]|uniref:Uncharacterized protein n=1 Tax=Penicillium antarcticum TaxID=416450 RepID=A0A1V6PRG8_9EURO|nr:hypothetical protein PENANT_c047G06569 [Penicillium antarcticum]